MNIVNHQFRQVDLLQKSSRAAFYLSVEGRKVIGLITSLRYTIGLKKARAIFSSNQK